MKYCPTCNTRYDEEILRFCMTDGTPLVEEEEPAFIEMPSESVEEPAEDDGDITLIRKNVVPSPPPPQSQIDEISFSPDPPQPRERIIVPTDDEQPPAGGHVPRARVIPPYQPMPQQQPNTTKVVVLTILGTLAAMGAGAMLFWFLQNGRDDNLNFNVNTNFNAYLENINTNVNTNLGIDGNFNFNANSDFNVNSLPDITTNTNANLRTPTPTQTPRPSPSPTAAPDDDTPPPTPAPTRPPGTSPTPIIIRPGRTPEPPRMSPLPANRPPSNRLDGR